MSLSLTKSFYGILIPTPLNRDALGRQRHAAWTVEQQSVGGLVMEIVTT